MQILPAIDLLDGQAVRLHQGRYDQITVYHPDPPALAASFRGRSPRLHVVDLAGASSGSPAHPDLIREIIQAFGPGVQIGGGIRSAETADAYLALGADRIVLGTAAIRDPPLLQHLARRSPARIIVALDAKNGLVAIEGWQQLSTRTALDVARELAGAPIAALLYTDVARDGTQTGPNIEATQALAAGAPFPVIASGGVGSLAHIQALSRIPGVEGAIVGRALYEGVFSLEEAVAAAAPSPPAR